MIAVALALLAVAAEPDAADPTIGLPSLGAPPVSVLSPVAGECPQALALTPGEPPPPGLIGADGLVRCAAIAVPTSEGLTALARADAYLQIVEERPLVERAWRRELAYWHGTTLDLRKPPPIWARPTTQRWIGRAEAYGTVVLAALLVRGLQPVLTQGVPNGRQRAL